MPVWVVGTNLVDAAETVSNIAEDVQHGRIGSGSPPAGAAGLRERLEAAGTQVAVAPPSIRSAPLKCQSPQHVVKDLQSRMAVWHSTSAYF